MTPSRTLTCGVSVAMVTLLTGMPAEANMGLPMLMVVWPASWILLIPIILVEACVHMRALHVGFLQAAQISTVSNIFSTLIGIPVTWLSLLLFQLCIGGTGRYSKTLRGRIASVTLQSPWIVPVGYAEMWMTPAAVLSLCIPFFFMSVWTEYLCTVSYTHGTFDAKDLLNSSWSANLLSYTLIAIGVFILLVRAIQHHEEQRKERDRVKYTGPYVVKLVKGGPPPDEAS